jgi:hypothetical protein
MTWGPGETYIKKYINANIACPPATNAKAASWLVENNDTM